MHVTNHKSSTLNKGKSYDVNDVHKYMQSKKSKRIYEIKNEKEKQKREDEERKKKLAELYRKQRSQTASSSGLHENLRTKSVKLGNKNDSNSSNEFQDMGLGKPSNNNTSSNLIGHKTSKLYEQDMSKILLDKITYLLNDNDKLVEKQRKQLHNTKSNNQKVLTQSSVKRVDFVVSEYLSLK